MSETIDAQEMARLLDEWVAGQHPFDLAFPPSFPLSDEQRSEPIAKAAVAFTAFVFTDRDDKAASFGPFGAVFDEAQDLLANVLKELPEAFGQWHDLSVYVEDPFLAAKLQDLLWLVKHAERQQPGQYARDAIGNYLRFYDSALSRDFTHKQLHLCHLLSRVADLALEINAADQFHGPLGERCQAWLESIPGENHIWPIKVAARLLEPYRPAGLRDYIRALHAHYAASDDRQHRTRAEKLFELKLAMATTDDERSRIREAAAEMFLAEARRSSSATFTLNYLRSAGKWAQGSAGAGRLMREIRGLRSNLDLSADLKKISIKHAIPGQVSRQLREWIIEPPDFRESIRRLVVSTAGQLQDIDGLRDLMQSARQEPRLIDLIRRTHIRPDGSECCHPDSPEERLEKDLAREHAAWAALTAKLWIETSLDAIRDRYGLAPETITEFVTEHGLVGQFEGEAFGRAFRHYWSGDYDSAANVALPRIESALRNIALGADESIINLPRGGQRPKCGGYKPLGAILPLLKDTLGENAVRMLQYLLVDNHGMNLRDNYAHGIQSETPQTDAAIALWIALWLGWPAP